MKQDLLKKNTETLTEKLKKTKLDGTFNELPFKHCYIDDLFEESFANSLFNSSFFEISRLLRHQATMLTIESILEF
jgi:hypothetical protein